MLLRGHPKTGTVEMCAIGVGTWPVRHTLRTPPCNGATLIAGLTMQPHLQPRCRGLPTGPTAEIVDDHRTGPLLEPGNAADLAGKVRWSNDHPGKMRQYGLNARQEYEHKFTAERNYELLMNIYNQAIAYRHPAT